MKTKPTSHMIFAVAAALREQANSMILAKLATYGVTDILPAHGAVLQALFDYGATTMGELGVRINRKKNTVTSLIKTLEERGYCQRTTDAKDARIQWISLTPKGEAMREIQNNISLELRKTALKGIPETQQAICMAVLNTVLTNLKKG